MKQKLARLLENALQQCVRNGELKPSPVPPYVIEVPNNPNHGHYATNLPMALASFQRRPPREIAEKLASRLSGNRDILERVEIAGPGFINFFLSPAEWNRVLCDILDQGPDYGRTDLGGGRRLLVEFVSANPTGPLHLGHGRGAAVGDTLCRVLSFCGYDVTREFYINDAGRQVRLLGESIYGRWRQAAEPDYPFPEDGYQGEYILDLAKSISGEIDLGAMPPEQAKAECAERGKERMMAEIREDLDRFGCSFDVWYKESDLFDSGRFDAALQVIGRRGELYEKDGALWIGTSRYGDDKDRVIRKKDGEYTYFASDISYHLDKRERGFQKAVNIWGADHHGYINRVKAALKANEIEEDWLTVLLIQLVKLWKGGREIKMSKRAGQYVTIRELMEEVGVDAVRFVFLTKSHDSPLDFDIDLVQRQEADNPVYYVQYAHARICSVFRKAESEGLTLSGRPEELLELLSLEEERAMLRYMALFPSLLQEICTKMEPHRLTYYLTELSSQFHRYFNLGTAIPRNRIVNQDPDLSRARLCLSDAIRTVLRNGLNLLGVNAPERM